MPTRVVFNGRAVWQSRDFGYVPRPVVVDSQPIDPDAYHATFREGEGWLDPDDRIAYRIVRPGLLDPELGWGTVEFWLDRYNCELETLRALVERGMLDAAIEDGSPTKRFRCRDEAKVLEFLKGRYPRRRRWIRAPRRVL